MAYIRDYKDVIKLAYMTEAYWQTSKWEMVKGHHWYTLNIPIATPKSVEKGAPPTAPSLVNDAADHLAGNWPEFQVQPLKEDQNSLKDQERIQMALNQTYDALAREYGKALHRSMAIHGGWSGMMCARVSLKQDWDVENPTVNDFRWEPIDPRWVFPDPGSLGGEFVVVRMRRTVGSIRQLWGDWEGEWFEPRGWGDMNTGPDDMGNRLRERLPDTTVVDWLEYWDDKVKCFIANGFPVFRPKYDMDILPHGLGCNPFVIKASGYGDDTGEPHERFRSMLYYVFHLLTLEANLLTQLRWIVEDMAWPVWLAPESMRGLDVTPGTVNYVPDREDIKVFKAMREDAVEPKAVMSLLTWVQGAIERATYPVVLKGEAPSGVRAGYPIAILSTQAKLKFASPADALRAMMKELAEKTLLVIKERIEIPVETVKGFVLKPEDYDRYHGRISCLLEPNLPTDRAAMVQILEFGVSSLGLPKTRALRELGFEDPEELRALRKSEDIEDDPRVLQELVHHALKRMSPEYAQAVETVNESNLETQRLQQENQVLQGKLQLMQTQMQLEQMKTQLEQMKAQGTQPPGGAPPGGGEGPPAPGGQPGMPVRPGVPVLPNRPELPPAVPGPQGGARPGSGGSGPFGQNPGNPNNQGQSFGQVNPLTAMRTAASTARAARTLTDLSSQESAYGEPGGGV